MCDEETEKDNEQYLARLTRRDFGVLTAGAVMMAALPPVANALTVVEKEVTIKTPDGLADAYFVHPATGTHPGVLVWPDILGLRPAFRQMGKRLAQSGYAVLTVNPFYRSAQAPVVGEGASFSDPETRAHVLPMARALSAQTHFTDAQAFVDFLDSETAVAKDRRIGTTGYCMGGPMTMRTAAHRADRIGAGASFHGGGLATSSDSSPHLLVPQMKAQYLIAVADNDDQKDPDAKNTLAMAFEQANLKAEIEVYKDAMHGWCPPDSRVYHEAQAEKAWGRLLALFERAL